MKLTVCEKRPKYDLWVLQHTLPWGHLPVNPLDDFLIVECVSLGLDLGSLSRALSHR